MKEHIVPPTQDQYEKAEQQIINSYAPHIYPCAKCAWPVVDGYCCGVCGTCNPKEIDDES